MTVKVGYGCAEIVLGHIPTAAVVVRRYRSAAVIVRQENFCVGNHAGYNGVRSCRSVGRNKYYVRRIADRNNNHSAGFVNPARMFNFIFIVHRRAVSGAFPRLCRFHVGIVKLNRALVLIDIADIHARLGNLDISSRTSPSVVTVVTVATLFFFILSVLFHGHRTGYCSSFAVCTKGENGILRRIKRCRAVKQYCRIGFRHHRVRLLTADGAFAVGAENVVCEVAVALVADRAHGLRLAGSGAARVSFGYFLVALSTFMRMVGFVLFRPIAEFVAFMVLIAAYIAVDVMFFCAGRIVCLSLVVMRFDFGFGAACGLASASVAVLVALCPFAVVMRAERGFHGFKHGGLVFREVLFAHGAMVVCDVAVGLAGRSDCSH